MKKEEIDKKAWNLFAKEWAVQYPPMRPSAGEIKIYEKYLLGAIRNKKNPKAIIMGATPELRDLCAKHKVDTTLVDINPNMVRAMDELLEYSDNKEKKVIGNWLEIDLEENNYDVILGDHCLHWIEYDKWDLFFKNKSKLLKDGGCIILSTVTVEKKEAIGMDKVVDAYKKGQLLTREDKFYYWYRASLEFKDTDSRYKKNSNEFGDELKKYFERGIINQKDLDFLELDIKGAEPLMPPKEAVDEALSNHFTVKSVGVNLEHPALSCHKIYFCQKK
jgi:hypothetical protein